MIRKRGLAAVSTLTALTAVLFSPIAAPLDADVLAPLRAGAVLLVLGVLLSSMVDARISPALDHDHRHSRGCSADVLPSTPPLFPMRVFFTLRHTAPSDLVALAFPPSTATRIVGWRPGERARAAPPRLAGIYNTIPSVIHDVQDTMSPQALALWCEGHSGIGGWPVRRPVEMTIAFHALTRRQGARRIARLHRSFGRRHPVEVTNVHRCGDLLYQDSDVVQWELVDGAGEAWGLEDLMGATVRVRTTYRLVDDVELTRPPRFHNLQLYFGAASTDVLFFTEDQLASPRVTEERRPLPDGDAFRVFVLQYDFVLTADLLDRQLVRVASRAFPQGWPRPTFGADTPSPGAA